ncbi:DUF6460 domain-containing protein [Terasakiella sp. A23]|uniref:DUF6460 domain-containing protein n=1 Tax=Terasakiella sp. FCG-A23 TaxID=3080561 RepID=UPI0029541366|nr:DUF6460 domain-containing protein [Terasakiella sp. A23]MDV7338805.1 DUF6460 domain-containing protein [Terasakiella sp. A23]
MGNHVTKLQDKIESKGIGRTILRLIFISLLVGVIMSFFDITPQSILENFGETVSKVYGVATGWLRWMVPYILLGATIVVPVWAVLALLKMGGRKRKD